MKTIRQILLAMLLITTAAAIAQNKNPYKSIGKKGEILTLTKGRYEELFDKDSIQQIGTALVNLHTMKVVKLLKNEEAKERLQTEKQSRFLSAVPLLTSYPELTPYQFASNRPIDGIDLDGLEYVKRIHTVNAQGQVIATKDIVYYTKSDQEIKAMGGTPAGKYNSAGYGPEGKGIKHEYYYQNGKQQNEPVWELRGSYDTHGLYSGDGSITYTGRPDANGKQGYDFSWAPIDAADAIAKRHDKHYTDVGAYNVVEDSRTLSADQQMVDEATEYLRSVPFKFITGQRVAGETIVAAMSQKILMSIFADYKQWKKEYMISNSMDPTKEYDNRIVSLDIMYYKMKYINSDPERIKERIANLVILLAAKKKTDGKKKE